MQQPKQDGHEESLAFAVAAAASCVGIAHAHADTLPKEILGKWCADKDGSSYYKRGKCDDSDNKMTVNAALADPKLRARLAELDGTVLAGSPTDFGKFIADETEKWGKVIRAAYIKAE